MINALCVNRLILFSVLLINKIEIQTDSLPGAIDRARTILGEIQLVRMNDTGSEIRLNGRVILEVKDISRNMTGNQMYSVNPLIPTSINQVIHQRIAPFDEVVILNNGSGSFHCGPGVAFLGLKKNGAVKFSRPTSWCSTHNNIKVENNSIEVTARADVHNGPCGYLPILGGKWIYKQGKLYTIKAILLPDPVKKRKPCI